MTGFKDSSTKSSGLRWGQVGKTSRTLNGIRRDQGRSGRATISSCQDWHSLRESAEVRRSLGLAKTSLIWRTGNRTEGLDSLPLRDRVSGLQGIPENWKNWRPHRGGDAHRESPPGERSHFGRSWIRPGTLVVDCVGRFVFRIPAGVSDPLRRRLTSLLPPRLRRGRSDQGSSPWSTPPRSLSQTSPSSPRTHRLPRGRATASSSRRPGRHGCRST